MKNISPFLFTMIALTAISVIMLLPIDAILIKMSLSGFHLEYVGLTIKMALIFILSYGVLKKMNLESISGLSSRDTWQFKYLNSIPIYLMILGVFSIISKDVTQIHLGNVVLLLFACLTVGFAEEFLFRGLLQSLFLKKYHAHKYGILISTLISAVVFGLFHLINLTKNDDVLSVLIQVVFAMFIGFFFGVLVLKTNKLIPIAITHGLINFFFSLAFLPGIAVMEESQGSIAPIFLTLPLLISGLLVVKKINKEDIIRKIEESKAYKR